MTEDSSNFSLLVLGTFACIFLRNLFMGKQIKLVMNQPLWKTDLPPDKRRALFVVLCNARKSDVTKFDEMGAKYSEFPTKIFAAVVYGIVNILKSHRGGQDENNLLTAFAVFAIGGVGIGGTRHGSLILDIIFRCVFGAGFIAILHFLAETPDIILIKSLD